MSDANQTSNQINPWKWATITIGALLAGGLIGGVVIASFDQAEPEAAVQTQAQAPAPVAAPRSAPVQVAAARPTSADIAACNQAAASARTTPQGVLKDGVIGGAIGAGVGAAGGAIAGGGKGAGKGAGIGAIVGATAGTMYGLNKANQDDARAETAYRTCMAERGF
jgi:hypothetical protein